MVLVVVWSCGGVDAPQLVADCQHPTSCPGYFAYGEENLSTIYPEHNVNFEDKDLGDYKEGLDFGPEVPTTDPHYGELFHTPNKWPDPVPFQQQPGTLAAQIM